MSITSEKKQQIDVLLKSYDKNFGKGTVQILSGDEVTGIERLSSGIASLDDAMGGGWARGRIHELYGPESSGKTTLALEAIAQAQAGGGVAAIVDAEHALDMIYAQQLGVEVESLIFSQPDSAEQALNITTDLVASGLVDVVVLDSVAALTPEKELDGDVGDSMVGVNARLMGQALRKIKAAARRNNVIVIFINQIRMKIGVMFGSPETTPGGNALKFFASMRLDVRRTGTNKVGEESVSNKTKVTLKKNKTAPPFRFTEFDIEFGKGVNKTLDLVRIAVRKGIVEKSGSWYSYNDNKIGQGERNVVDYLEDNDDVLDEIRSRLVMPTLEDNNGISERNTDI
jgi:recombination protein RecA